MITTGEGRVTFEEVKTHPDRLLKDPDFDPEFNQLIDARGIIGMSASPDQVRMIAQRPLFSPKSRRAFIVTAAFTYGMARMLQTYNEMSVASSPMSIFGDRVSALKWLGISEDHPLVKK